MLNIIKNTATETKKAKMGEKLNKDEIKNLAECVIELSFQAGQVMSQLSGIAWDDLSKAEKNILQIVMDKSLTEIKSQWPE